MIIRRYLLHESIHARWKMEMIKLGIPDNNTNTRKEYWLKFLNEEFGIAYVSEHSLMAKEYLEIIARELWDLNGRKLTIEHYFYYVYEGLEDEFKSIFSEDEIYQWKSLRDFLNIKNVNGEKIHNNFNCN